MTDPTPRPTPVLLGFAFVAAWIALSLGDALLCLAGAGAFRLGAALLAGDVDLEDLRARLDAARAAPRSRPR